MERLGFGYEELSERNPGLVYCSAPGFGAEGPYADRPGQDLLVQALSGLASLTGRRDDPPTQMGTTVVDFYTAAYLALAVVTALHHRERTGEGQKVEGDLLSAAMALQAQEIAVYTASGEAPERSEAGIGHAYNQAPYGIYETEDGYLALSLSPPADVGRVLGLDELRDVDDWVDAYERRDEIKARLEAELRTGPTAHWLDLLRAADVWCAEVNDLSEAVEHPQVEANDVIRTVEDPDLGELELAGVPIRLSETPVAIHRHPPRVGEHTEEVLEEFGCSPEASEE